MPRGGARVGAGRKPKKRPALTLVNSRRELLPHRSTVAATSPDADAKPSDPNGGDSGDDELALPPADLQPAERDVWRVCAPLAIEAQTLTPTTVVGFRELCTVAAITHALADTIHAVRTDKEAPARAYGDALKLYTKYAQRLDGLLARFKLTAFGKPVDGAAKPTATVNPWAEVAKK